MMDKVITLQQSSQNFISLTCRYGFFSIYLIMDGQDNIINLTFSKAGHQRAMKQLAGTGANVSMQRGKQKSFTFNSLFAEYFSGNLTRFSLKIQSPFIHSGTEFQKKVWTEIAKIPYGQTRTYGELARAIGNPGSARAVGLACGANPLALIIPCHRVVGASGLGGFAGGADIKKKLLELEKIQ
jgi:O-6-methylguanine DNA methyltransferase